MAAFNLSLGGLSLQGKKQLNLIIGFDVVNFNLKIMSVIGRDVSSVKVDFIPVPEEYFVRGEWNTIITLGIAEYIAKQNFDKSFAVHLVLPDNVVATDVIIVPTLNKSKMITALESQIKDLYFFYNDYKFNKTVVSSNKTNTTFELLMVSKPLLNSIYKALGESKLYIKNSTYASNSSVNAVFSLRPKLKKQSFLFLDIKPDFANLIAISNGMTVGWKRIKFGYNLFLLDKVTIENNVVFNDIAQVAVINATERAKKKKMTSVEDDDDDIIKDTALVLNDIDAHDESDLIEGEISASDSADLNAETGLQEGESSPAAKTPPKAKTYQRKMKRLPAYMQRPVPETQELISAENFRLFVKHVLLMKMQIGQAGIYNLPSFVLVNMPSDYGYIIDEANKDNDGFEFRYFDPSKENNVELTEHLDLYGALYMEQFNKNNNV